MIQDESKRDEIIFAQVEGERPPRTDHRPPSRPPQPPRPPAPVQDEPSLLDLEESAIEALQAYDPHWRKDPGDIRRRERMQKAEIRVSQALQLLPQEDRVDLWRRFGEGAAPLDVIMASTPQLDMESVPF